MPTHDIIDNRSQKLVDHINRMLDSTERARFAVGYFFLSGLESIAGRLERVKELRLLIGNTTNRETLEQMAEGYRRLELVRDTLEEQQYPKRTAMARMAQETAVDVRSALEYMDQSDDGQTLVKTLVRMIEEQRLKVRVYTKGRLHAKAYIFDYYASLFDHAGRPVERYEEGVAIVGSSNLTLSGVSHNTELNVIVHGNDNHDDLGRWFDDLWEESQDFDAALMREMQQSWAVATVSPYDIYMKALHALVKERIEGDDAREILWDDEITQQLADFQKVAVRQAVQIIRDFGGAFVSDVVGLGKSYIGAAIVKHFERTEHARPLIVCPASLVEMWERINEVYQLNARVISLGFLRGDEDGTYNYLLKDTRFRDRDFVLVDESHNFRHSDTQRYKVLQSFLATGRPCCFLTATPRNKSAWDVYAQIKLFHQDDKTDLPVDPPILKDYFRLIEKGERKLPDLLANILIRRTRNHILRWYGYDAETHQPLDPAQFKDYLDGQKRAYVLVAGKEQFFPRRVLGTVEYSIEDTYGGLYQQLRRYLGVSRKDLSMRPSKDELLYARYGLWHYVIKDRQRQEPYVTMQRAGANLRGLMRVLLFKRFESSVYAFRETVRRLLRVHRAFLDALALGVVPAGEEAQAILHDPDYGEEEDLQEALQAVSGRYKIEDFDTRRLREHIEHDIRLFQEILLLVEPISPQQDAKLQALKRRLAEPPISGGKALIFTQYADTARYLYDNLNPGDKRPDIEVIYSGDKNKSRVVGRFAPKANPEYQFAQGESEIMTLISTDVLAEGLNLQDCDNIINYDLHWNPVRLIQRFGRIDRIGSQHDVIYGFNFLPETGIEKNLGLRQKLHNRIQEIHDTIGEDSEILDRTERLNEEAMYAIYEQKGQQLSLFEEEDEEFLDLNEAEEIMRQLRRENPTEYERIASLRDGIRAGKRAAQRGLFVFCQAGRYQQLFLVDDQGNIISRNTPRVLGALVAPPEAESEALPTDFNAAVMRVKRRFDEEVRNRRAEREHTLSLTQSQRYVTRELRELFKSASDEDEQTQISLLEKAFRGTITTALNRELNVLRRNGIRGRDLFKMLSQLYFQHNMQDWADHQQRRASDDDAPRIVCSEALIL